MTIDIDPDNDAQIRSLANEHWLSLRHAMATGGDIAVASAPQLEFMNEYLSSLPADESARVFEIYAKESERHAAALSREEKARTQAIEDGIAARKNKFRYGIVIVMLVALAIIFAGRMIA